MSNKDIETNINENTEKSETPKKKNIVHVFRPQNTQNGGNKGRRSGGNRQNSGQGKQMQANNGRPAKRPAAQNTATGEAQAPNRADGRKETKDRTEMKEQKDQTETTTEITAAATDAAAEETDVVIVRKEEADRDSREATVRRMAVPTEIRETAITDMTTTVVMTDRDANSEKNQITEEMTEEITQAFRLLQSKDRNHRERMPREKTITRRKIIVAMMKKECQRVRRKTSRSSSFRNHSRKSRR